MNTEIEYLIGGAIGGVIVALMWKFWLCGCGMKPLEDMGKFATVVIDPPWR